jgi:hypothetical protein
MMGRWLSNRLYLSMEHCPVAVDPVIALNDTEKQQKNPRSVPVNRLMEQESKWTDGKQEKYLGRSNPPVPWMHPTEAQPPEYLQTKFLQYEIRVIAVSRSMGSRREM